MNDRLQRVVIGGLVVTFAAAPSSAAGVATTPGFRSFSAMHQSYVSPRIGPRVLTVRGQRIVLSAPVGCTKTTSSSFVGNGIANYAGGGTGTLTGLAGVVDGSGNEACDLASGILDGESNVVGGNGLGQASIIAGGESNGIVSGLGFIGAGDGNLIAAPPLAIQSYPNSNDSAIVGGQGNSVSAPQSVIAGGSGNAVTPDLLGDGASSFVGAGAGNLVAGTQSAIVAGSGNQNAANNSAIVAGTSNIIRGYGTEGVTGNTSSFIGGGDNNIISNSVSPVTSGDDVIVGGASNQIFGSNGSNDGYNVISGGASNAIGQTQSPKTTVANAAYAVIAGGQSNAVNTEWGTISGGNSNTVTATSATIGGGSKNTASGPHSVIAGGTGNSVSNESAAVAGGLSNVSSGYAAVVGGGSSNKATNSNAFVGAGYLDVASGNVAVVGGGYDNVASGAYSTIPGGAANIASGADSFAAGTASNAATSGAFVWSDNASPATQLVSSAANQFLARASGGFYLYSSANLSSGVKLAPGSGSWSTLSDRAAKYAIANVDDTRILARLARLPISEWSYTAQGSGVRHLGPMAQDFRAAFGLGEDDRHISTVDEEGVALAAIKALQAQVAVKDRQLSEMQRSQRAMEKRLEELERRAEPAR